MTLMKIQTFGGFRKRNMYFAMAGLILNKCQIVWYQNVRLDSLFKLVSTIISLIVRERKYRRWKHACPWGSLEKLGVVPKVFRKGSLERFSQRWEGLYQDNKSQLSSTNIICPQIYDSDQKLLFTRFLYQRFEPKTRRRLVIIYRDVTLRYITAWLLYFIC